MRINMMRINMMRINMMRINILICIIGMYINNLCEICKKYIPWFMGYMRIYDIDQGIELTYDYYVMKIISMMGYQSNVIKKIGICGTAKGKPVRYILHDKTINQIHWIKNENELRLIRTHEISKIIIHDKDNDSKMNIDVTDAKKNYYEIKIDENHLGTSEYENEKISDMIKLYMLSRGMSLRKPMDAMIVRKIFDDEIIRYIDTCEIINING